MEQNSLFTPIKLIECPRDAMQGWKHYIPTKKKTAYINALLQVGFDTIDFGSFVSSKSIPQMADTKQVISGLQLKASKTKLLAIVANTRGAQEAVIYDKITCLGFPFSISPTFQLRNTNSTIEESLTTVNEVYHLCLKNKKELVVYMSMGFGNPYGDTYDEDILVAWVNKIILMGINVISLADTVGLARPGQISSVCNKLTTMHPTIEIGVHLHSTATNRALKIDAALQAGCKRFDGALMGIGGCPMADDELVGNMDTKVMISYFESLGISLNLNKDALQSALNLAAEIFG